MGEGGNQENIRKHPGKGTSKAGCYIAEYRDQEKSHKTSGSHLEHTCQNGEGTVAHPLNGKAHYIDKDERYVKSTVGSQKQGDAADRLRFPCVHKQKRYLSAEQKQHKKGSRRIDTADDRRTLYSLSDPLQLLCPHILSRIGGHGTAQGIERTAEKQADLASCSHRRHCHGA